MSYVASSLLRVLSILTLDVSYNAKVRISDFVIQAQAIQLSVLWPIRDLF